MNPDFLAALADALVFRRLEFAVVEVAPELLVFGAVAVGRLDKHAVMLAFDLVQAVAERLQEILVGGDDRAVEVELDHGLGLVDGGDLAAQIHEFLFRAFGLGCGFDFAVAVTGT